MQYKKAYLHLFNRLTDLLLILENPQEGKTAGVAELLRHIQMESETMVIGRD